MAKLIKIYPRKPAMVSGAGANESVGDCESARFGHLEKSRALLSSPAGMKKIKVEKLNPVPYYPHNKGYMIVILRSLRHRLRSVMGSRIYASGEKMKKKSNSLLPVLI